MGLAKVWGGWEWLRFGVGLAKIWGVGLAKVWGGSGQSLGGYNRESAFLMKFQNMILLVLEDL